MGCWVMFFVSALLGCTLLRLRRVACPPLIPPPRARAVACAGRFAPNGYATAKPLLSTPAGVEKGAWILRLVSGQASKPRTVATVVWARAFHACGRSQRRGMGAPTTATAARSAVNETERGGAVSFAGLATGWRSRQPWRADQCEFSTTIGSRIGERRSGGDEPHRRSVTGATQPNQGSPLYPGGGREGRGGERGATKATNHKPPQAGCKALTTERRTEASKRSCQRGF